MPELPEVEVVKRSLEKKIINLTIKKVTINTNKLRYSLSKKDFNKIINTKILSIKRRSKYLLINLQKNYTIVCHLGMTGKFFIIDRNKKFKTSFYYRLSSKDDKHNHIIFKLSKKVILIYNDVRKFGFIKIIKTSSIISNKHISLLGPEPLSKKFNAVYFKRYIINKKKKLKDLMMDQKFVSGLGNIYANEILFLSKLNPKKNINKIENHHIKKILFFTKKILLQSIKKGGSSIKNFNSSDGKSGKFQQMFNVYAREGGKCAQTNCKQLISRITISNRSTFICKRCQK